MALPALVRAVALAVLAATASSAPPEAPQSDTCGPDEESADTALLQKVRLLRQKKDPSAELSAEPSAELSAEACDDQFTTYPYLEAGNWGTNYIGWETCGGRSQSPINLKKARWCNKWERGGKLPLDYRRLNAPHIKNTGYHLKIAAGMGDIGTLRIGVTMYDAKSFHFHSPSEHTVEGKAAVAEMHIVHMLQPVAKEADFAEDDDVAKDLNLLAANQSLGYGPIAVVGILFDIGSENKCLKDAFSELTRASCQRTLSQLNLLKCFKKQVKGDFWFYDGSLTTPPCTEGVNWFVFKKRATISKEQLKLLQATFLDNARPTQKKNGRQIGFHKVVWGWGSAPSESVSVFEDLNLDPSDNLENDGV